MKLFGLVLSVMLFVACNGDSNHQQNTMSEYEVKEALINANKAATEEESIQIDGYVRRRNLDVIKTGTGLRYMIYQKGDGEQAKIGQRAVVAYEMSLIDGTVCYSTKELGPEEFKIGNDRVESGLHEAICYMRVGDKAKIIIPSHLAHGLVGDREKIPIRSTIIYDLELIKLK